MSSNNNYLGTVAGFLGLLTTDLVVLKLAKCIAWSWWWVLAPAWIPVALILHAWAIVALCLLCIHFKRRARR